MVNIRSGGRVVCLPTRRSMQQRMPQPEARMDTIECKECRSPMKRIGARPMKPGYDLHTYRCLKCERVDAVMQDTRFGPPGN